MAGPTTLTATAGSTTASSLSARDAAVAGGASEAGPRRPRRRWAYAGPRCPQCAGPLVFGEGCSLCPICGHSSCAV